MKKIMGSLLREEKGQALPIALILLALGSLIVYPLVSLTHTSLASGQLEESRMYENYAANAGISDGLRQLIIDSPSLPAVGNNWIYTIPDTNDRQVTVTVNHIDATSWRIDGTATSGDGHSTELNAYVYERHYLPNAITATSVTINTDAVINGNVQYSSDNGSLVNNGTINGQIIDEVPEWPSTEEVEAFYLDLVQDAPTHEGDLNLVLDSSTNNDPYSLGPIYINGNLSIDSDSTGAARLDGPVYVNGSVTIDEVKIYQNDNTLYAGGAGGIVLNVSASLLDSGCIISKNPITMEAGTNIGTYLVLWSLEGNMFANPAGQGYCMLYSGELDTSGEVTVKAGKIINYVVPSSDLLLPPLPGRMFSITSWESSTQ